MTPNKEAIAESFGRDLDPLAKHEETFRDNGIAPQTPFDSFIADRLEPDNLQSQTIEEYRGTFDEWIEFMQGLDRYPACPSEAHAKAYIEFLRDDRGNARRTIENKLRKLNRAFQYWQDDSAFPHSRDFNPIENAKKSTKLPDKDKKEPPRISLPELRERVKEITHIRDRAVIVTQLKLGLRASELANIRLSEIHLDNPEILQHYEEMGTDPGLNENENAIYVPHDREGNKSQRPRILPLDDELRRVLSLYLRIRPDNGNPHLFLSQTKGQPLEHTSVNRIWKVYFHPDYAESENHEAITSHYGRHWFTTYWRIQKDINREKIKYMRGDVVGNTGLSGKAAIDEYLHTYYPDIEDIYREGIFKLNL